MEDLKQQIKEGRKGVIELKKRNKKSDKEKERKKGKSLSRKN